MSEFLQLVLRRARARRALRARRARLRDHLQGHRRHQLRPGRAGRARRLPHLRVLQRRGCRSRSRSSSRVACAGLVGAGIERVVLRHMVGQPVFAVIMVTIGLLYIIEQVVTAIWGFDALNLGDPWGVDTVKAGGIVMATRTCGRSASPRRCSPPSSPSSASPSSASPCGRRRSDQEAALAQGISARRVFAVSWAISAGLAALAGVTLASGAAALTPTVGASRCRVPGDDPRRAGLAGGRRARRADHRRHAGADVGLPAGHRALAGRQLPARSCPTW